MLVKIHVKQEQQQKKLSDKECKINFLLHSQ